MVKVSLPQSFAGSAILRQDGPKPVAAVKSQGGKGMLALARRMDGIVVRKA